MGKFDRFFNEEQRDTPKRKEPSESAVIRGLPDGRWVDDGVYRMDFSFEFGKPYGKSPLFCPDGMTIMKHFGAREPVVFLDLETTGLAGGSGTYAFLCGIGISSGQSFNVTQLFLSGPAKEPRWLKAIEAVIPPDACLVTYNGKTFDIPLLRTRHILSRSVPVWSDLPHIDLLHHARRLYRGHFESCSLGSMEKNVLQLRRSGEDIPGYMIPPLYIQYLNTKDAAPLRGVFYHNRFDIASLAALYCHIAYVLEGNSPNGYEIIRAGDTWYAHDNIERAVALWEHACEKPQANALAYMRKGFHAKREKDYGKARHEFLSALDAQQTNNASNPGSGMNPYALLEELAKLEEHKFRSPETALAFVRQALAWLKQNRYLLGHSFPQMNRSMLHRASRLDQKIKKGSPSPTDLPE